MRSFGTDTVIYTKPTCPHCIAAKDILHQRGIAFTEIAIDGVTATKESMCKDLGMTDLTTVPQIVLRGSFIPGGCSGLKRHFGIG